MRNFIKIILITILFLGNLSLVFAQQTRIELGDRYFEQHAYNKAIPLFEAAKKTRNIYAKLGDCYYYTAQPEKALVNYKEAFKSNKNSNFLNKYRLRFALCLHSTGDKISALAEYKKYYKNVDEDIDKLSFRDDDTLELIDTAVNLDSINSPNSDFGTHIFNDILYFSSSREKEKKRKHNKNLYKWNEHPFLEIYTAKIDKERNLHSLKIIPSDSSNIKFNKSGHEASLAFFNENTMYFSGGKVKKNNKIEYNKRGISNLRLQIAKLEQNQWVLDEADTELLKTINLENYSVGNPAFNKDKTKLFFVSCAPYPDAMGQSDIYYVEIKDGKPYGEAKSVPLINTGGRESFPFVSSDGTLYFSSDGYYNYKLGFGLLDIYKVDNIDKVIEMGKDSGIVVDHLGSPFNSNKDDFAFFIEKPNESLKSEIYGYFSSNREHAKAKGSDDIYRAIYELSQNDEMKIKTIQVNIKDSSNNRPLENGLIELMDSNDSILSSVQVGRNGASNFELELNKKYRVRGSMKWYYDYDEIYNITEEIDSVDLKLEHYPCEFTVYHEWEEDSISAELINEVDLDPILLLMKSNSDINIIIESHTDSSGPTGFNLNLSQKRAKAAKDYLISKKVDSTRIIKAEGFGEKHLLFSDEEIRSMVTKKERDLANLKNRRSRFIIVGCDGDSNQPDN